MQKHWSLHFWSPSLVKAMHLSVFSMYQESFPKCQRAAFFFLFFFFPQHKMCGRKELLLLTEDVVSCGAELGV